MKMESNVLYSLENKYSHRVFFLFCLHYFWLYAEMQLFFNAAAVQQVQSVKHCWWFLFIWGQKNTSKMKARRGKRVNTG